MTENKNLQQKLKDTLTAVNETSPMRLSDNLTKYAFDLSDTDWYLLFKALTKNAYISRHQAKRWLSVHIQVYELWHRADNRYSAKTQLQAIALQRELLRQHKNSEELDVVEGLGREIFEIWNGSPILTMTAVVILVTWNAFFSTDF